MIRAEVSTNRVKITGHAGYGTQGNDLICAAVSMLWYAMIVKLEKEKILFQEMEEEGYCEMWLMQGSNIITEIVIDTISCGLEILEQNYPQNIFVKKL